VGFGTAAATGYSDYASLGRYSIIVGGPGTSTPPPTPSSPPTPTAPPTPTPTSPLPPTPTVTTPIPTTPIPPTTRPGGPAQPSIWTGSLRAAVSALALRSETPTGFSVARFPVVDADHDCRSTRTEVLAAESWRTMSWTNARHCTVRTGGWFSLFDRRRAFSASQVTAVWTVPLTEAWRSGARSWPAARRQAYANDLADPRTLLAVTTRSARSRADREPQSWLPAPASRCAYVAQWVAVKLRWALSVDRVEQAHLASLATSCPATRLTVHRA
jgi:hypothetical protein